MLKSGWQLIWLHIGEISDTQESWGDCGYIRLVEIIMLYYANSGQACISSWATDEDQW